MSTSWRVIGLTPEKTISGILRFPDNKKFLIGDMTPYGPIAKFAISDDQVIVYVGRTGRFGIQEIAKYDTYYLDEIS